MKRPIGLVVLGLSACGFPLTQLVIRRWGVQGAAVTEGVCIGLVIRDTAMIASGVPRRLRPGVAALLWLELGASVIAAVTGLGPLVKRGSAGATGSRLDALEIARRASVGALFGLHTIRFGIYLRPDRGRRTPAA